MGNTKHEKLTPNCIRIAGNEVRWYPKKGTCSFQRHPVTLMWIDTTLASLMTSIHSILGDKRFSLALQLEGRKSVETEWTEISRFPDFPSGFKAIADIAAASGWGRGELVALDEITCEARFRLTNGWESYYQKTLGVCWGSSMVAGKLAGYCTRLFKTNCWTEQTLFAAQGDPYDEFVVRPSSRLIESEIQHLVAAGEAAHTDMAAALRQLEKEIAERTRAEKELRDRQELLHGITANLPGAVFRFYARPNGEMGLYYMSERVAEIFHLCYETADVFQHFVENIHPDDRQAFLDSIRDVAANPRPWDYEGRYVQPNGDIMWFKGMSIPSVLENEIVFNGFLLDITERKKAEEALRRNTTFLETLMEAIPVPVYHKDAQGLYTGVNKAMELFFRSPKGALIGKSVHDIAPKHLADVYHASDLQLLAHPGQQILESQMIDTDHKVHDVVFHKSTLTDEHGQIIGIMGVVEDVTEHKRAEAALRNSEASLRYRLEMEQTIAEASALMLKPGWDDFDERISLILERIGTQMAVDRSYLFTLSQDGTACTNTHEWCAQGVFPQKDDLQDIPIATYPVLFEPLLKGEPFVLFGVADVPQEAEAFRAVLANGKIQSLICVPIHWDGRLRGFIGFDSVREKRTWPEDDVRVAHILAEIIARALQNRETNLVLHENADFLEKLDHVSRIFMQHENEETVLDDLLTLILEVFQADRAYLLHPCDPQAPSFQIPVEVVRPGFTAVLAKGHDVPIDAQGTTVLQKVLYADGPVILRYASMPDPPDVARDYGIQSEMTIALHPSKDKPWMLGLHQCTYNREWTLSEQRLFKAMAERIGDALSRHVLLKRLRESETNLQTLFNTIGDFLFILDSEGRIIHHNPIVSTRLKYSPEELLGKNALDLHPPQYREEAAAIIAAMLAGEREHCEIPLMISDGTLLPVDTRIAHGTWSGIPVLFGVSRDITELKRVEEVLRSREHLLSRQSEALLSLMRGGNVLRGDVECGVAEILEVCSNIIGTERVSFWVYSGDYARMQCADLYERSRRMHSRGEELAASRFRSYTAIHQAGDNIAATDVLADPRTQDIPRQYYERYGICSLLDVPVWLHNRVGGVLSFEHVHEKRVWSPEEERFASTMATLISLCLEVSEREQTQKALRSSETKYRRLHETMMDGFVRTDLDGYLQEFNRVYAEMLGYSEDELHQLTFLDITPRRWHEGELRILQEQVHTRGYSDVHEKEYQRKDGTVFPVELRTYLLKNEAGQPEGYWAIVRDISARKKIEDALIRMQFTVESASDMIFWVDSEARIVLANDTACRILGYAREELLSMKITDIDPLTNRDDPHAWIELWNKTPAPGVYRFVVQQQTKDGRVFPVDIAVNAVQFGEHKYHVLFVRDITERKQAEEERVELERRLLHAQKLESLGVLAGGIAHDFNNLLMAILGSLDMALLDLPSISPVRENIEQAIQATRRATHLTHQMLAYSGKGRFVVTHMDLNELVKENADMFRAAIARTVNMAVSLAPTPCVIEADPGQIQQVVMNLITNASEAIGDTAGTITLRTGARMWTNTELANSLLEDRPAPGEFACIEVTDTGCGMSPETIQRLFEPFFTTKFTGRGLGMSAVLGIVRGHKGAIFVDSIVGGGTTITVLFPLSKVVVKTVTRSGLAAASNIISPTASGAILVVDDEETVRKVCASLIRRLGFDAITAADGEEGLRFFAERGGELVCVLLDLTMPGMDGVEAFHEMKRLHPEIPVILCSGYNQQDATSRFTDEGLAGFIQKPYRFDSLRDIIQQILAESGKETENRK